MTMAFLINYQQNIDDLVSWYVNVAFSSILFSLNSMLPLVIGNLVTSYLNSESGKLDYRKIGELILEARLGNSFFIIPHVYLGFPQNLAFEAKYSSSMKHKHLIMNIKI
jgi:hypothetical protein